MEHEKSKMKYQGAQIAYEGYDELTHFTESQFTYMLSRNRSTCGVRPYVKATCNPDADSWVRKWVAYYIGPDGFAIPERSGVIRYFVRVGDELFWDNSHASLWDQVQGILPENDFQPKSFTFIPAKLEDNPALLKKDPSYRANLLALNIVDRERLLGGNWDIRFSAGTMFHLDWFTLQIIDPDMVPSLANMNKVRSWDTAATEPGPGNPDPDWTAGILMGELDFKYYFLDLNHFRKTPGGVEAEMVATAEQDGKDCDILLEQEPGSAAKREADRFKRELFKGYKFTAETTSGKGDKVNRAKPLSGGCERGWVYMKKAPWNMKVISELVNFPDPEKHDDIVDAAAAAYNYLAKKSWRPKKIDLEKSFRSTEIMNTVSLSVKPRKVA
jgi:predicted phage terminase large subunit-like protein